tara:strand:- start:294 stop:518 length:225 start_codon:yes stop_codon:yes gene_type:complete
VAGSLTSCLSAVAAQAVAGLLLVAEAGPVRCFMPKTLFYPQARLTLWLDWVALLAHITLVTMLDETDTMARPRR